MRSLNSPQKSIHLLAEKWGNITSLTASCNREVIHRNHVLFFTFAHIFLLADSISLSLSLSLSLKRGQIIFCIVVLLVPGALEGDVPEWIWRSDAGYCIRDFQLCYCLSSLS